MTDDEKARRILEANPELGKPGMVSELKRWTAITDAGVKAGLKSESPELAAWTAYWMTGGKEGRLPDGIKLPPRGPTRGSGRGR